MFIITLLNTQITVHILLLQHKMQIEETGKEATVVIVQFGPHSMALQL
jgi:hypothetical protein